MSALPRLASGVLLSILVCLTAPAALSQVFTGHVPSDFTDPGTLQLFEVSNAPDIGMPPQAPPGAISGWDISSVAFQYDVLTDRLNVGIETFGIAGDADGDGDEAGTSVWLALNSGADLPDMGDTESFALLLDLDLDGTFDVIVGVPGFEDLSGFTVAQFSGVPQAPAFAFGAPIEPQASLSSMYGAPSATAPHIEFSIGAFSQLPGFNGTVGPFRAQFFMGSLDDDGIGDDRLPDAGSAEVCLDADADGYSTCDGDCDDSNPSANPGALGDPFCDGVDDDCDGETDEDFGGIGIPTTCGLEPVCESTGFLICMQGQLIDTCVPGDNDVFVPEPSGSCGVGPCERTGMTSCETGVVTVVCEAGEPAASDDCNGIDDDCDGALDEDLLPTVSVCGVGNCESAGVLSCVNGALQDTCTPGAPTTELCNGLDEDCDGVVDNDPQLPEAPTCGTGACVTTGTVACVNHQLVEECVVPNGTPEVCNGIDDDCDGVRDEGVDLPEAPTCGEGACFTTGVVSCTDGKIVSECTVPEGSDEVCNGIDDDCDGTIDEDVVLPAPPTCGLGACATVGLIACVNGAELSECVAPPGTVEICNGIDDDCDGVVDDDPALPDPPTCGVGACETTGLVACINGEEVSSCVEPEGSEEICNGIDDDCDGEVDEPDSLPDPPTCGDGECFTVGTVACVGGVLIEECQAPEGSPEVCNGLDDDCDGSTDFGVELPAEPPTCGVGACATTGIWLCDKGELVGDCGPLPPSVEECNGIDDDCDGVVDNDVTLPDPPTCGDGACRATGTVACVDGQVVTECVPGEPSPEICNEIDDDCDGATDFGVELPDPPTCGEGACQTTGTVMCEYGQFVEECTPLPGSDETCNGVDDDCDGVVDNDVTLPAPPTCGVGECLTTGTVSCVDGEIVESCVPEGNGGADDNCDGVDDDCDGSTDEGFVGEPTACGEGECAATGMTSCVDGEVIDSCRKGVPGTEVCNGSDDDCDGTIDEDYVPEQTICGVGSCQGGGETACINGEVVDQCRPGDPFDEVCDGLDTDCDGTTDEDVPLPDPPTCGEGACFTTGTVACVDGEIVESCEPATGGDDTDCDGVDDDCDGSTDEGFVGEPTACGEGECAATGMTSCVDGEVIDSCRKGVPGTEVCNGTDDDCDGTIDEDYVPEQTICGVGSCQGGGETACINGEVVDQCRPGDPFDEVCDGLDTDCDGTTDEDVPLPDPPTCGVGECLTTGTVSCVDGEIVESCVPEGPGGADDNCDAVDDDCDGMTDEGFVGEPTSCGTAPCDGTGMTVCEGGTVVDTCKPGDPSGDDDNCDGSDDDCDGMTDEGFVGEPTTCGTAPCDGTGMTVCEGGTVVDTCKPGDPSGSDDNCDGSDDDCDGSTDEGFVGEPTTCGTAPCDSTGMTVCKDGTVVDTCEPGGGGGADDCDAVDNDCDGLTDEDFVSEPTSCGLGVCGRMGETVCDGGTVVDTCVPGEPEGGDDDDDGDDDDGDDDDGDDDDGDDDDGDDDDGDDDDGDDDDGDDDGDDDDGDDDDGDDDDGDDDDGDDDDGDDDDGDDDDGDDDDDDDDGDDDDGDDDDDDDGGGHVADGCDGLDNDCDGLTDEDFVGKPTTCGAGLCGGVGETVCVEGEVIDTCMPGTNPPANTGADICDDGEKLSKLTFNYVGAGCGASDNDQGDAASCEGDPQGASPVYIVATNAKKPDHKKLKTWFAGTVALGGTGVIDAAAEGADRIDNTLAIYIYDAEGGALLQEVRLHTSCSKPIHLGDQYGAIVLTGFVGEDGTTGGIGQGTGSTGDTDSCDGVDNDCDGLTDEDFVGEPTTCGDDPCPTTGETVCDGGTVVDTCVPSTPGGPTGDDICDLDQKIAQLTFKYVGQGCDASDNAQGDSAPCSGDPQGASPVYIVATNGKHPSDDKAKVWFAGNLALGGTGLVDAANAGEDKIENTLVFYILDVDSGELLQEAELHASCSKPIHLGDQYGAIVLTGFVGDEGASGSIGGGGGTGGGGTGAFDGCDAVDNDCDGLTDEDFVGQTITCGDGPCPTTGETVCDGGTVVEICEPPTSGPTGDDICDLDQKIAQLTFKYVGQGCDASDNAQGDSAPCSGDPQGASPVYVVATNGKHPSDDKAKVWFAGNLALGGTGLVDAANAGEDKIENTLVFYILDVDSGALLQEAELHASCSKPIHLGDQYGAIVLTGFVGDEGASGSIGGTGGGTSGGGTGAFDGCDAVDNDCDGLTDEDFVGQTITCDGPCPSTGETVCDGGTVVEICEPPTSGPTGDDICDLDQKIAQLTFKYVGQGCDASDNAQGDSAPCSGDPQGASPVYVVATNGKHPSDDKAKVWFAGNLALGGTGLVDAANAGEDKIENTLVFYILDVDSGALLQEAELHASCSKPIHLGDQYGAIVLTGFVGDEGASGSIGGTGGGTSGGGTGAFDGCDAVDNDCDGLTDEDFVGQTITCGDGPCPTTGETVCDGGTVVEICEPPTSGPTGDDICDLDQKIAQLTFKYVGQGCDASDNAQGDSAPCSGDPQGASPVYVVATNGKHPSDDKARIWFAGNLALGGTGLVDAANAGEDKIENTLVFYILDVDSGALLQEAELHASCSKPIHLGDQYGAIVLTGFVGDEGASGSIGGTGGGTSGGGTGAFDGCDAVDNDCDGLTDEDFVGQTITCDGPCPSTGETVCDGGTVVEICAPPTSGPTGDDICDLDQKIAQLTFKYVGQGCDASDNAQGDKAPCTGDPNGASPAYIVATNGKNPSDDKARIWFSGNVAVGGTGVVDAANVGEDKLENTLVFFIMDPDSGDLLQETELHVSCSAPIHLGDQYGAIVLTGFVGDEGASGSIDEGCACVPTTEICDGIDNDCDGWVDDGDVCICAAPSPGSTYLMSSAHSDECHGGSDSHSIWLPGFFDGDSSHKVRMTFGNDARFEWDADGVGAHFYGSATVSSLGGGPGDAGSLWYVEVALTHRGQGPDGEGLGGPKTELAGSCQPLSVSDTWDYFDFVPGEAYIWSEDDASDHASLVMYPAGGVHPLQLGEAANNKNAGLGFSTWFTYDHYLATGEVISDKGDFNVDLDCK